MTTVKNAPKARVLLVEDDRDVAAVVSLALEDFFDVVHARSVNQARESIAIDWPDLILLDWHLGGECGGDLLAALGQENRPRPPVIVTTGCEDCEVLPESASGVAAFLPKPFQVEELVRTVTLLLIRQAQRKSV